MGALEGKVALVTGAAQGLGRASARIFAREGARVVVVDLQRDAGQETVRLIKAAGGDAPFVTADVSRSADVQAMVRATVDTYCGSDCAMNNVGIETGPHPLAEIPEDEWNRSIAVNLTGVFLGMKYEIPAMLDRGGGAIVNVSSGGGLVGADDDAIVDGWHQASVPEEQPGALIWCDLVKIHSIKLIESFAFHHGKY